VPTFVFLFLSGYLIDNGSWNASLFNFEVKFLISISLIALIYHIFAGLRHMLIDFSEYGHELTEARLSALIVFLLTAIFSFFAVMEVW
jgi:succinate dehydrogenase / fumarate reductase cytochrome b subunit